MCHQTLQNKFPWHTLHNYLNLLPLKYSPIIFIDPFDIWLGQSLSGTNKSQGFFFFIILLTLVWFELQCPLQDILHFGERLNDGNLDELQGKIDRCGVQRGDDVAGVVA